jgi:hypothetical protein
MISDVMRDGVDQVLDYLKDDDTYKGAEKEIAIAVVAMERLRLTPRFDIPLGFPAPALPTDPEGCLSYLNMLLAEKYEEPSNMSLVQGANK